MIVDRLGLCFDIDPDFLRRLFFHYFSYADSELDGFPDRENFA